MIKLFIVSAIICLAMPMVTGCSDKNSLESCRYQTTMDLDKGNYDAVLQSPCVSTMQSGAAHFGKAGFDVKYVINGFIDANTTDNAVKSDLSIYMSSLVSKVSAPTFTELDLAKASYGAVPSGSESFKDAQFYISLVDAVKTFSLIKTIITPSGAGAVSSCDINGNTHPDEADAAACVLLVSGMTATSPTSGSCPGTLSSFATFTTTTSDITFSAVTGTYRGLIVTMATTTTIASCPEEYRKLLYLNADNNYYAATTSGTCMASDGQSWPCPLTSSLDLVTALQTSINDSVNAMNTAITGTSSSDVVQAIKTMQTDACGNDGICTSTELAAYFQTL